MIQNWAIFTLIGVENEPAGSFFLSSPGASDLVYRYVMNTLNFLVQKDKIQHAVLRETPDAPLADGQVRIRIDKFALTSNNITYAAFGDAMNYWNFFPVAAASEDGAAMGQIQIGRAHV